MKLESLYSKEYSLLMGNGQGRGTFIIIRHADDLTAGRWVCGEGIEFYKQVKRAYRQSIKAFNDICSEQEYD